MQMASRWKGFGVYIAESAECHFEWKHPRGLDDFDGSFSTEKGDLRDMNNSRGLYEFDSCVCEDCVCSDGSSYQL